MMSTLDWQSRRFLTILGFLALLGIGGIVAAWWLFADLPPVTAVELRAAHPTTQILDRTGNVLYEVMDPETGKQLNLDLTHIPQACVQATIATEDSRFFLHPGVDPLAIVRAVWQNFQGRGIASGASTLTQQLARNLLMSPAERYEPSYRRKAREAWLAWQLERHYTKEQLLALYLNQTYYGNFAFGIEAAAQIFFAKPTEQLSRAECALLAGLVQYPTGYNPLADPEKAKNRQLTVLRLMRDAGFLNEAEAAEIAKEPLHYRSHLFDIEAPHFVMYVQALLAEQLDSDRLRNGGLRVHTTLDLNLQQDAEAAVRRRLDLLTCRAPGLCDALTNRSRRIDNAAAVILDSQSGELLTMIGSPDYFDPSISGNVNAALSQRQPGSAIKPFTYAAALDPAWSHSAGLPPLTPASILPDLPATFYVENVDGQTAPYRPQNYDRLYHGPVSVRTALANSYNIPAVEVLDRIGVETLRELASQAGIRTFTDRYGLALTLGGGDVRLIELTAAYGIFDDGHTLTPQAITGVYDERSATWLIGGPSAESVYGHHDSTASSDGADTVTGRPVLSPQAAYLITDILSDDVARAPAFGRNSILDLPFPAAVKTGTTTDWRDNWTVGYSTQRLVGVWVGNADNAPMFDVSGVDGAGPIWHDLMRLAHPRTPPPFVRPPQIVETQICAPSGMLPTPECPRLRNERFIAGTEPTDPDSQFQRITLDLATGLPATDATPPERQSSRVYWMLPPTYYDWMTGQNIAIAPPGVGNHANGPATDADSRTDTDLPLILVSPASFTRYQVHPGLPDENQRLELVGFVANGAPWESLHLVVDGTVVASATDAARLSQWWSLTLGTHQIWLEGEATRGAAPIRSSMATITVEEFEPPEAVHVLVDEENR